MKKNGSSALEEARARLRTVPPKQFTALRHQLANELKDAGQSDAAAAIKKERKRSTSVWAVNALAREAPDVVARVLEAGSQVRLAQRRALSGAGGAEVRAATRAMHDAVREATSRAAKILRDAQESTTPAVLDRIRDTLIAAAQGDEELRSALREGRIEANLSPAGFGMVAPLRLVQGRREEPKTRAASSPAVEPAARKEPGTRRPAELARGLEALRRTRALIRKEAARAEKAVQIAEQEHARLEKVAAEAERRAREAREQALASEKKLSDARRALEEAQRRLDDADSSLQRL